MSEDGVGIIAVTVNSDSPDSVMAALVMSAAVVATGDEVFMFFQPGAARVLVKGELEKYQDLPGMPNPMDLYESILILDGRIILCELGLPNKGIEQEDLREGVELMMASTFLFEIEDAKFVFSY